jgi:putative transposase
MSGIRVIEIDPYMTSQSCSRCGSVGERNRKLFKCINKDCMHIDHSDVNAAFEIAQRPAMIDPVVNENNRRGDKAVAQQLPLTPSSGIDCSESKCSNLQNFNDKNY